jgi:hypothetical protein
MDDNQKYVEIKSAFTCDCCHLPAIFYSNAGEFKTSTRCYKHKPSFIKKIPEFAHYDNYKTKHWVVFSDGISINMQKHVDELYLKSKKL